MERVSRRQTLWWWLVFLAVMGAGYLLAQWIIDPVTILLPAGGIEV